MLLPTLNQLTHMHTSMLCAGLTVEAIIVDAFVDVKSDS